MRSRVISALLVVVFASTAFAEDWEQTLKRARAFYARAEYTYSIKMLDEYSNDPDANIILGEDYLMLGDYVKSLEHFNRVLAVYPRHSFVWNRLGRVYEGAAETRDKMQSSKLRDSAKIFFEKAVEIDLFNVDMMNDLLEFYLDSPDGANVYKTEIETVARKIETLNKSLGLRARGKIAEKRGDLVSAEKYFREALASDDANVDRALELEMLLSKKKDFPDKAEAVTFCVWAEKYASESDLPRATFACAKIYLAAGDRAKAKMLLEKYLKFARTPSNPPVSDAEALLKGLVGR